MLIQGIYYGRCFLYRRIWMGILSALSQSRDKPSNRKNGSAHCFLMGGSSSGRRVNECYAIMV